MIKISAHNNNQVLTFNDSVTIFQYVDVIMIVFRE